MKTLGQYQILEELGRGGMGVVYKARQPSLNREVAVKVLPPSLAHDSDLVERFLREARAAAGLDHPNIVTIHDVGQSGDTYFFAMQYLTGRTLEQLIREQGPLAVRDSLDIAGQLLDALDYAHRQGLIHRDIKPANVIMAGDGRRAVITDFGIARAASETRMTRTGMIFGSPLYMSPEQLEGKEVDHRSDLYSLGALVYQMLAGTPPYQSGAPVAVLNQRLREPVKSVRAVVPAVPPQVDMAIQTLMAVDPDQRFPTAAAARLALGALPGEDAPPPTPTIILDKLPPAPALEPTRIADAAPPPAGKSTARRALTWCAALLCAAVATLAVIYFQPWNRNGAAEPPAPPGFTFTLGHTMGACLVSIGGDGRLALSTGYDGSAMLWDLDSGRRLQTFREAGSRISASAISPDGTRLGLGREDGTVRILETVTGKEISKLPHQTRIVSLQFLEEGDQLVTVGEENRIRNWQIGAGRDRTVFDEPSESLTVKALSADGRLALTIDTQKQVGTTVWDLAEGIPRARHGGNGDTQLTAVFSPDGRQVLSGGHDGSLRLWDARTGEEHRRWAGHTASVEAIGIAAGGTRALTGDSDGRLKLWELQTGRLLFEAETRVQVLCVAFTPDGRKAVSGMVDGTVLVWDSESGGELFRLGETASTANALAFADDPRYLVVAAGNTICRWDLETVEMFRPLTGHDGPVTALAVSPDGRLTVSGGTDQTVRLWRMNSGMEIDQLKACTSPVTCAAYSPDGLQALTGCGAGQAYFFEVSGERTISLWDTSTRKEIRSIDLGESVPSCLAFSPDGLSAAVGLNCSLGGTDHPLTIRDLATGRISRTFSGQTEDVISAAFTPDGKQVLAAGSDGSVGLWNTETGERERLLRDPDPLPVTSVAVSADGRLAAAAERPAFGASEHPAMVRIWNLDTGQLEKTLDLGWAGANSLLFSPDGRLLVSAGADRKIRVHRLDSGRQLATLVSFADGEWVSYTPEGYFNASPNGPGRLDVRQGDITRTSVQSRQSMMRPGEVRAALRGNGSPTD